MLFADAMATSGSSILVRSSFFDCCMTGRRCVIGVGCRSPAMGR